MQHNAHLQDLCTYSGSIIITPGGTIKPEVKGARAGFLIKIILGVNRLDHPVLLLI